MAIVGLALAARAAGPGGPPPIGIRPLGPEEESWDSMLPIFGDKARARGYSVPLPLGISANAFYMERAIEVKSVEVSANGGPFVPVDDFLDFGVKTHITSVGARFDCWLFPFLNIYALGGAFHNESAVRIDLINPVSGVPHLLIDQSSGFDGSMYGYGATISGGFKRFFATVDLDYTVADLGFAESVTSLIYTSRIGWNGMIDRKPFRAWVGVAYWDSERAIIGSIALPGGGTLQYDVLQAPLHPWNAELGATMEFTRHWTGAVVLDSNFNEMFSVALNLSYRF